MKNPFEKVFKKIPQTPRLEETDTAVYAALVAKMEKTADSLKETVPGISQKDIEQAAFYYARMAEKRGEPFTKESVEAIGRDALTDTLSLRIEERLKGDSRDSLIDSRGMVHQQVGSVGEAITIATELRQAEDRPSA